MFRRRTAQPADRPEWQQRIDEARAVIDDQNPPVWIGARLTALEGAVASAVGERSRLSDSLARLDPEGAARELKQALSQQGIGAEHQRLVDSLRERYASINRLANRVDSLDATIEAALADVGALAARAVALGGREEAWRLDEVVNRLGDDITALEQAHLELDGW